MELFAYMVPENFIGPNTLLWYSGRFSIPKILNHIYEEAEQECYTMTYSALYCPMGVILRRS